MKINKLIRKNVKTDIKTFEEKNKKYMQQKIVGPFKKVRITEIAGTNNVFTTVVSYKKQKMKKKENNTRSYTILLETLF